MKIGSKIGKDQTNSQLKIEFVHYRYFNRINKCLLISLKFENFNMLTIFCKYSLSTELNIRVKFNI